MKAIDELIEKYKGLSQNETHFLETVEDLETLKEQLKEQHKETIGFLNLVKENPLEHKHTKEELKSAWLHGCIRVPEEMKHINNFEQYYQQTHEKK